MFFLDFTHFFKSLANVFAKNMKKKLFIGGLLVIFSGLLVVFFAKNILLQAYQNDGFWANLIQIFYPRFLTEKHRFSVDFFVQKIQQIGFRLIFLGIFGSFLVYFSEKIKKKIQPIHISTTQILWLQRYFCVFLLWCVWDWAWILYNLSELSFFYQPVFLLRFFGKENFSFSLLICSYAGLILGIFCVFFNQKPLFFSVIIFINFIFLQGYLYSFHKIDHTFAPVNYVCFLMVFLFWETENMNITPPVLGFAPPLEAGGLYSLLFIQIAVALCYSFAGLEKILIGGTTWFLDAPLQHYLRVAEVPLGVFVAQSYVLCWFLGVFVLLWELFFIWAIFQKKYLYFFLFVGFMFHLGTFFLMNVGGFPHTWVCLYVFFSPQPQRRK